MNEIALNNIAFSIARTTKSGKVQSRDLIGVLISGNPAERLAAAESLLITSFENADYSAFMLNMERIFGKAFVTGAVESVRERASALLEAAADEGITLSDKKREALEAAATISTEKPTKAFALALLNQASTKSLKGEKGKFVEACKRVVNTVAAKAAEKEARRLAHEAQMAAQS